MHIVNDVGYYMLPCCDTLLLGSVVHGHIRGFGRQAGGMAEVCTFSVHKQSQQTCLQVQRRSASGNHLRRSASLVQYLQTRLILHLHSKPAVDAQCPAASAMQYAQQAVSHSQARCRRGEGLGNTAKSALKSILQAKFDHMYRVQL